MNKQNFLNKVLKATLKEVLDMAPHFQYWVESFKTFQHQKGDKDSIRAIFNVVVENDSTGADPFEIKIQAMVSPPEMKILYGGRRAGHGDEEESPELEAKGRGMVTSWKLEPLETDKELESDIRSDLEMSYNSQGQESDSNIFCSMAERLNEVFEENAVVDMRNDDGKDYF